MTEKYSTAMTDASDALVQVEMGARVRIPIFKTSHNLRIHAAVVQ